jgi:hypothetical protein
MDDLPDCIDDFLGPPQSFKNGPSVLNNDDQQCSRYGTKETANFIWDDHGINDVESNDKDVDDVDDPKTDYSNNALVVTDSSPNSTPGVDTGQPTGNPERWLLDTASYRHYSKSKMGGTFQPITDFTLRLRTIKGEAEINNVWVGNFHPEAGKISVGEVVNAPDIDFNLLSIGQLTEKTGYYFMFSDEKVVAIPKKVAHMFSGNGCKIVADRNKGTGYMYVARKATMALGTSALTPVVSIPLPRGRSSREAIHAGRPWPDLGEPDTKSKSSRTTNFSTKRGERHRLTFNLMDKTTEDISRSTKRMMSTLKNDGTIEDLTLKGALRMVKAGALDTHKAVRVEVLHEFYNNQESNQAIRSRLFIDQPWTVDKRRQMVYLKAQLSTAAKSSMILRMFEFVDNNHFSEFEATMRRVEIRDRGKSLGTYLLNRNILGMEILN